MNEHKYYKYMKYNTKYLLYGGNQEQIKIFTEYIYGSGDDTKIQKIFEETTSEKALYDLRDNILTKLDLLCDKSKIQTIVTSQNIEEKDIKTDCEKFSLMVKGKLSHGAQHQEIKKKFDDYLNRNSNVITEELHKNFTMGNTEIINESLKEKLSEIPNFMKYMDVNKITEVDNIKDDDVNEVLNVLKDNSVEHNIYKYFIYFLILLTGEKNNIKNDKIKHIMLLLINCIYSIIVNSNPMKGGANSFLEKLASNNGIFSSKRLFRGNRMLRQIDCFLTVCINYLTKVLAEMDSKTISAETKTAIITNYDGSKTTEIIKIITTIYPNGKKITENIMTKIDQNNKKTININIETKEYNKIIKKHFTIIIQSNGEKKTYVSEPIILNKTL